MKVGDRVKTNPQWHLDFPSRNGEPSPEDFIGEIVKIHPHESTSGDKVVTMAIDFGGKTYYYTGVDRMFLREEKEK